MPAQKARYFTRVTIALGAEGEATGQPMAVAKDGSAVQVADWSVSMAEAKRLAAFVGMPVTFGATKVDALDSVRRGVIANGKRTEENGIAMLEVTEWLTKGKRGDDSPADSPTVPATMPATDEAAALEALRKLLGGGGAATVDEATVRRIVEETIGELTRPVEVHVEARETVTVDGAHKVLPLVLNLIAAGEHVYLVGPPGTGKSHLVESVADALNMRHGAISCSATMPSSALFGFIDAGGTYRGTVFRDMYENGGVFLLDEIDNGNPNVLAAMNQALANGACAFPDGMVKRSPDFLAVAAANTYGTGPTRKFIGRNAIDAATLDRFSMVEVGIDEALEDRLVRAVHDGPATDELLTTWRKYRRNVEAAGLDVVISPRTLIAGARMLAQGMKLADVEAVRVFPGLDDRTARLVREGGTK